LTKATKNPNGFLDLKLISRKEFAKHLDVEESTVRAFFLKHQVPTRKICGQVMFLMSDLLEQVPAETQKRDPSKARKHLTGPRTKPGAEA
jgi:hypothetical protein